MNTHPNQQQIIEAIKSGMSYAEIQKAYGCSNVMITYQKRKLGMKIKTHDRSEETDERIKKYLTQGKSYRFIIKKVGTHFKRIAKVKKGTKKSLSRKQESFGGWY